MKILLITNIFPPTIGGPATFIYQLARFLAERKHQVTVICASNKPEKLPDENKKFRVIRISTRPHPLFILKSIVIVAFYMLFHRHIFVNGLEKQVRIASLITRRKYVLKIVGDYVWETKRNRGETDLSIDDFQALNKTDSALIKERSVLFDRASAVVVPSLYLRNLTLGWGLTPSCVNVIYNGVDPDEFKRYQPQRRRTENFECIFVGRLTNWKGIDTFMLAVRDIPNVTATILGEGPEYPHLMQLAKQLHLENKISFKGLMDRDQIKEYMANVHALVLPSLYEGLSHTLLEAMAMGIPCIASARGGNTEVIEDRKDGLLVPPLDPNALSRAIIELKENEDFRMSLASRAKEKSKNFDFHKTVEQTVGIVAGTSS